MKIFTNKKIWQKIVIILLLLMGLQLIASTPVHAVDGDVLLQPVVNLFVSLGDAAMSIIQDILMQKDGEGGESLIKIDGNSGFWSGLIVTAVFIIGTIIAIVAAYPTGGTSLIIWVKFGLSVALTVTISGVLYMATYNIATTILSDQWGDTYYLPMYEVSPYEIFADKVALFDVNFFNPDTTTVTSDYTYDSSKKSDLSTDLIAKGAKYVSEHEYYEINESQMALIGMDWGFDGIVPKSEETDEIANDYDQMLIEFKEYEWEVSGVQYNMWYGKYTYASGDTLYYILNKPSPTRIIGDAYTKSISTAYNLQPTISSWYKTLRNIALVALLSILVYIGIRITLSSVASDKAKYKQMLGDWVIAICLVFLMHYIMSFSVTIVEKITDVLTSINLQNEDTEQIKQQLAKKQSQTINEEKFGEAIELFIITTSKSDGTEDRTKIENAWDILVGTDELEDGESSEYQQYFFTDATFETNPTEKGDANILIWPANNFMEQARMELQILREGGDERLISYGYAIIYIVLIIYTVIFSFTYLRRVLYMAFLTMIAPLVAVTYPIDKINDGKAQAFDMWLKEYIFNLLLQPLHLILYMILIGSAMDFAARNIFYVIMALGFFIPAEKLLRRFFGFEKAQTPGAFGGAAGAALMMSGLNKLMHKPPKGGLGSGGNNSKDDEENIEKPPKNKAIDATENLIGTGNDDDEGNVPDIRTEDSNTDNDSNSGYDRNLTQEQIEELQQEGIKPGDNEYRQYLLNHGIRPDATSPNDVRSDTSNTPIVNTNRNTNRNNNQNLQPTNNATAPKRKRSIRRAIGRGARNYKAGLQKRYQAKKAANGGIIKRGIRMAGGLAAATTMAAAGGLIGITSGDPSKAAQYMATGAAGGYALGKAGVNKVTDTISVKDTLKEAKKGYYGDEYKDRQKEKYEKQFIKDEENLKKIEDKMHVERKEAKEIAERIAKYTQEKGIDDVETALAVDELVQKGHYNLTEALTAASYNNMILEGKDTRHMKRDDLREHKQAFKEKLLKNGRSEADADMYTANLFNAMDKFNEYKN